MNRLLIVVILIIGTLPLYGQGHQPNTAELAQKVVGIIGGDKTKTQTYCQVLDLSDELDQVDQQKDRKKAEDLSQKINELQKTLAPNTSRCSQPLWTWIQIPKMVRRSCRSSISSIVPAETNSDVLISRLNCWALCRRSGRDFNCREAAEKEAANWRATDAPALSKKYSRRK